MDYTLDELKELSVSDGQYEVLINIDSVFSDYEKMIINAPVIKRVCNGAVGYINAKPATYRLYDEENNFLGIGEVRENSDGEKNSLKMIKAFY